MREVLQAPDTLAVASDGSRQGQSAWAVSGHNFTAAGFRARGLQTKLPAHSAARLQIPSRSDPARQPRLPVLKFRQHALAFRLSCGFG